ncbi:MAG: hypothetical protein QF888_05065 [Desulfobacterales bacterium]|jgi:ERCC4-type nuclease|nr:hypothetical protein [Desulfobacterales bacterium]MDP7354815.1 hypothetical protein [Desulfobacterales bacterium]MDP7417346.1 hypothetical protein [Desulfobacterales bacterium]HJO61686.1 hypothetical protein [Desulfobacterales bacterium]|tara:strand:+ start:3942 stop:4154 length:213 start_codon:yes stop_codon:yes gene_type:complete
MQGELITVSLILGIQVLRAKDSAETVKLIAYVARQIKTMARGGVYRQGYRPKDKREKGAFYFAGIAGSRP